MGVDLPNLGEVVQKVPSVSALAKMDRTELKAMVPGLPLIKIPKLLQAAAEVAKAQEEEARRARKAKAPHSSFKSGSADLLDLLLAHSVELLEEVRCRPGADRMQTECVHLYVCVNVDVVHACCLHAGMLFAGVLLAGHLLTYVLHAGVSFSQEWHAVHRWAQLWKRRRCGLSRTSRSAWTMLRPSRKQPNRSSQTPCRCSWPSMVSACVSFRVSAFPWYA